MNLEAKILGRLLKYVAGLDSLESFEQWFVPISVDIERSGDARAIALVHRIDGILAEASSADWSQQALREELQGA